MQLSKKKKIIWTLFSALLKSRLNFEIFEKEITVVADVIPKLGTAKEVVREMSKKSFFRRSSD